MPKANGKKKRMFREVSHLKRDKIGQNYLKDLRAARMMFCDDNEVSWAHLEFLLWAYDKEFWTINYAADEYGFNKKNFGNRILWPLMKEGLVFKYYDKLTPSDKLEDHLFREETKYNYRVRYAITQRARMVVQAFYRRLGKD